MQSTDNFNSFRFFTLITEFGKLQSEKSLCGKRTTFLVLLIFLKMFNATAEITEKNKTKKLTFFLLSETEFAEFN